MKIQIVKNKYINSLLILMLGSAIFHMILLFFLAIKSYDLYILNYFNILDIDLFSPNIFNSVLGNFSSFLFVVIIYLIILKANNKENE